MSRYSDYGESGGSLMVSGGTSDWEFYQQLERATTERETLARVPGAALEIVGAPAEAYEADLLVARAGLVSALSEADAPVTNRKVACALEAEAGLYSGENNEPYEWEKPRKFVHAELTAVVRFLRDSKADKIDRVLMAGIGQDKIKQIAPCFKCYDMLSPLFHANTELILFEPNTLDRAVVLGGDEHPAAYERKDPLAITGHEEDVQAELREKTALPEADIALVAELRRFGIEHNIEFYLTGSASGRGWISQKLKEKTGEKPTDLDIVAVTNRHDYVITRLMEKDPALHRQMRDRTVSTRQTLTMEPSGKQFVGRKDYIWIHNKSDQTPLEIVFAPELSMGMLDSKYYERNMYVKLT